MVKVRSFHLDALKYQGARVQGRFTPFTENAHAVSSLVGAERHALFGYISELLHVDLPRALLGGFDAVFL